MVGREAGGGVHAVTFSVLKQAYCWAIPEVPLLKAFGDLLRPGCPPQRGGARRRGSLPTRTHR